MSLDLQDLDSDVFALSLDTGALRWSYLVGSPSGGPNGVAVSGSVVYDTSPDTVFALRASTGRRLWVDHVSGGGKIDIQPQVADGRVYLATADAPLPGGGLLFALDVSTGRPLWKFRTVPGTDKGVGLAGGAWDTPLVTSDGSVTYGTGNPYQSASWAYGHPAALPYTDSAVK